MLENRMLMYALEIGRQGSFTKAAKVLHIAQPSLSQQIAKLEQELGLTLFYRSHQACVPTPDGVRFLERAGQIVRMQEDLVREMRERSEGIGSELTIGTPVITGEHVLPPLLETFRERYPQVRVRIVEDAPKVLADLTLKGITDLSILPLPVENANLAIQPILTEPILIAFPPQYKAWMTESGCDELLARPRSGRIPLSNLSEAPFILLRSEYGFRQTVLELCAESGFQPEIAYETSSIEMAQALVAHGHGITLIPAMVKREGMRKSPNYFELAECPTRTLAFIYRKNRYLSLSAQAFLKMFPNV